MLRTVIRHPTVGTSVQTVCFLASVTIHRVWSETNTICSCRSIAYGTENLCCPKGFRPYIADTNSLPYIKKIVPSVLSYYLDDVFYGNEKDLCRPCPGLFGLGVEESETFLLTPTDATNFWWTKP